MTEHIFGNLYKNYSSFKEPIFFQRRTKHEDLERVIVKLKQTSFCDIRTIGFSFENRSIRILKAGTGKTKILAWSQMHGNESTGTQVIFDVLNFFKQQELFVQEIETILSFCTLYFIPMLNPDGAEVFKRHNAFDIDINRDAIALTTNEGRILMQAVEEIKPNFAFNLHDQEPYYGVKNSLKPAAFSFLSPAFNEEKTIDIHRQKAMEWISKVSNELEVFIPGQYGKYADTYMDNAFGDNIQKHNISTILIESGWLIGDPEKQIVRRFHFAFFTAGIYKIALNQITGSFLKKYEELEYLKKNHFFDVLIRNISLSFKANTIITDIGIKRVFETEKDKYIISEIGDLSNYAGFKEKDFEGAVYDKKVRLGAEADLLLRLTK